MLEKAPGWPPATNHQVGPRTEGPPGGLSGSVAQQRQSTLAQLQLQVALFTTIHPPEAQKKLFTKHQLCMHLFLCPRLIRFPNSFTDSHIRITGAGIRTRGSLDPLDLHHQPGRSLVAPPPPRGHKVWASKCGNMEAPKPTLEAPHHLWYKTLDSQLLRWVGAVWKNLRFSLKIMLTYRLALNKSCLIFFHPVSERSHQ